MEILAWVIMVLLILSIIIFFYFVIKNTIVPKEKTASLMCTFAGIAMILGFLLVPIFGFLGWL